MNNDTPMNKAQFDEWCKNLFKDFKVKTGLSDDAARDILRYGKYIYIKDEYLYNHDLVLTYESRNEYTAVYNNYAFYVNLNRHIFRITNLKTGNSGFSKYRDLTDGDFRIAFAVAWARFNNTEIPFAVEYVTDSVARGLKTGTTLGYTGDGTDRDKGWKAIKFISVDPDAPDGDSMRLIVRVWKSYDCGTFYDDELISYPVWEDVLDENGDLVDLDSFYVK